ncbi:YIF1-domain-containing protein [Lentinula raphanica]|uniref:Protein YIF1 n=1 Tax=Lentinula raphanica TaxID=153919 RepID=A0AA38UFB2_9AGAR|nr:YIF1-domain-containing protein [Lentinula raphanica]KAJ3972196.1 YIF1-domain-containing protein [Lentinula raphanica]
MSSPPPLRHPVPTHPAYIPEPPSTPGSPNGYQRFSSSPGPGQQQQSQSAMPQQQHVPAYMTSPFQHSQQQQQHSLHPPHQPHQPSFVPQPDFAAWGVNDATAQFGMQLGSSAVAAGQEYVQKNFGGIIPLSSIKHHFNVSNSYVIHKLKLVVFPWTHKSWSRRVHRSEQGQAEYQDPREDINSPDLYIPLMAFVTYILISAFHSGLQSRFHPKILGESASSALAVVIVDFLFVYIGCYLLNVQASKQAVDIIAYSGYKFVGVIFTILSSYLYLSRALYYIIFFYFFFANGLFLLRSLRSLVLPDPALNSSTTTISSGLRRRRISFLLIEAACQFAYMLFLVRV